MSTLQHPLSELVVFFKMVLLLLLHLVEHVALSEFLGQVEVSIRSNSRFQRVHNVGMAPIHASKL